MLRDFQTAEDTVYAEASLLRRCVARHNGRPIAKTEPLKLSNLPNKVTSIVRRDSSFLAIVKSVINFSDVFKEERGVSYLAARGVDIVMNMVLFSVLSGIKP